MTIPPQNINEIRKGENLIYCGSCNRILYLPEEQVVPEASGDKRTTTAEIISEPLTNEMEASEDLEFTDEMFDEGLDNNKSPQKMPLDKQQTHGGEPLTRTRTIGGKQPQEQKLEKEKIPHWTSGFPSAEERGKAQKPPTLQSLKKCFLEMLQIQQEKGGSTIPDKPDSTLYDKVANRAKIQDVKIRELSAKAEAANDDNRRRIQKTLDLLERTQSQKFDRNFIQTWLYENYKGHCQICHPENFPSTFQGKDGKNHFVRHYLVKFEDTERYLDESNALCLCPTHHSMLEYADWDLTSTIKEDLKNPLEEYDEDGILFLKIRISINVEQHFIRYREEHFEMLKVLVEYF